MNITVSLNSVLGSLLLLILIFIDYARKYDTDSFQRSIFLRLLALTSIAAVCDLFYFLAAGYPKAWVYYALMATRNIFFLFQPAAYFYTLLFFDYAAHKNKARTNRFTAAVWCIIAVYAVTLLINIKTGVYFSILRSDNVCRFGALYGASLIVSLIPPVCGIADIVYTLVFKKNKYAAATITLIILFIVFVSASSAVDNIFRNTSLVWPVFTSMILYTYFFIIRQDARIDPLTKIGNRFALDEFIDKLSRQTTKESWVIVMIDMDHFKEINDTLGHAAGDMALRDMAAIITESTDKGDFAARYGGDEFIIATKKEPPVFLSRLQSAIQHFNNSNSREYQIQMSFGYDVFNTGSAQLMQEFLGNIDALMYTQKKYKMNRRGKISTLTPLLRQNIVRKENSNA
ncbi:MAG: hypothetical protein Pg6C_16260 [Treponemataceae bacterium]|nr:MAG: hypothetical protein Pg6C_16260 [Treponemataceae bacterium]